MNYIKDLCSICCLSYNHALFIEKAIESIWAQDYKNIEILALDDGSSDDSGRILKRLQAISPVPMKVILQKNTGKVPLSFNTMISMSSGEYITFLSLDDKLYPGMLSSKIQLIKENENLVFIASKKWCEINDSDEIIQVCGFWAFNDVPNPTLDDLLYIEFNHLHTFHIQGTIFRRKYVDAVNGFDNDLVGDDIVLRNKLFLYMKENPHLDFDMVEDPGVYYRIHANNAHKNISRQIRIISECLNRYYPNRQLPESLAGLMRRGLKELTLKNKIGIFFINKKAFLLLIKILWQKLNYRVKKF